MRQHLLWILLHLDASGVLSNREHDHIRKITGALMLLAIF